VGIHHRIGRFRVAIILGSSLAVLSSIALAQDTEQWLTGTGPQPQMADSSKKPKLNVGGCWQGPEETLDSQGNVLDQGQLYIDFIQRGSKLLAPVHNKAGTTAQITSSNGSWIRGGLGGSVKGNKFRLSATHRNCNISIAGTLQTDTGGDQHLVGTQPQTGFVVNCPALGVVINGNFDILRDSNGCIPS
jgi:hypothetical protein